MPFLIAFCVEDVSFDGLLTRRHSQTRLPCTPLSGASTKLASLTIVVARAYRIIRRNSLGCFGWISAFREEISRSTSRMLFACSSGPIDLWIREMTGVSRLASITSFARASSAAPDCWPRLERGCIGMDHALYFPPENNIGVTENVCPHCELNVLIVNI
jgi:hypothetical protein